MLNGTGGKRLASSSGASGRGRKNVSVNTIQKLFTKMRRLNDVEESSPKKPTRKTPVEKSNEEACKKRYKVKPVWADYRKVFETMDDLKIQLPLFGSDRLSDQFYKLIDPLGSYHDDQTITFEDQPDENDFAEPFSHDGSNSATGGGDFSGETNEEKYDDSSAAFHQSSFQELFVKWILRALTSPFDIDVECGPQLPTADAVIDDKATSGDRESARSLVVQKGLDDYSERAANIFGAKRVNVILQFKQALGFRWDLAAKNYTDRVTGTNENDEVKAKKASMSESVYRLKKIASIWETVGLQLPWSGCSCGVSCMRVYVIDSDEARQPDGCSSSSLQSLARSSQQSHVLFNIGDVLYRYVYNDEFAANFIARSSTAGLKNRQESRCSFLKTKRVQSMAFYRRIYAVQAALYALVCWLWYRQASCRCEACGNNSKRVRADDVPPVGVVVSRSLALIFTRVRTVFLELLLQRNYMYFHFI